MAERAFDPAAILRGIRERLRPEEPGAPRRTRHPGSKKGAVHVYRGKGNAWKAVTGPRRKRARQQPARKQPGR